MTSIRNTATAIAVLAITLSACSGAATSTPAPATVAPSTTAPVAPSQAASVAPSLAASVPAASIIPLPSGALVFPNKLEICADLPYPPQVFFDANGNPTGSDPEIGAQIASRLGVTSQIVNSVFDTIIAAVTSGKCDLIIGAQNITNARVKQIDFIPYYWAGEAFLVAKGNPDGIKTLNDLCGKAIAVETGSAEIDNLNGTGDYAGQGLSAACVKAGKPAINVLPFSKDSAALLALQAGQVAAHFTDSPVAGYYAEQHPDQFELSGLTIGVALEGIGIPKNNTGLRDAVQAALVSMINDGTYLAILKKYGMEAGAVTVADAMTINKIASR